MGLDNNTEQWSEGINFVQFMKNRPLNSGTIMSPYKAMSGSEPRVVLSTFPLINEVICKFYTKDNFEKVLKN
jgi:hypothetical protein